MLSTTACRATGITRDTLYQPEALSMLMVETETIPSITVAITTRAQAEVSTAMAMPITAMAASRIHRTDPIR